MTVKCTFCKDTKIEPGIPGPCVWCEEVEPVTLGTVTRYAESCGEGGGVVEHASGQFVEFKDYDAALGREAALREELESIKASVDGYDSPEHAAQVADEMGHQCDALQQRLTVAEQRVSELKKLLCAVINESPTGFADLKVDLANQVNDALQPAEEGEGS